MDMYIVVLYKSRCADAARSLAAVYIRYSNVNQIDLMINIIVIL